MQLSICWFTFSRDADLLRVSVSAARRVFPNARICIFDERRKDLPRSVVDELAPDIYRVTDFPRRGNLNGWECSLGILDCLAEASTGGRRVIKMDSDTMLLGDTWLYSRDFVGFSTGRGAWCFGMCYAIYPDLLSRLRSTLESFPKDMMCKLGEDVLITSHAVFLSERPKIHPANSPLVSWWRPGKDVTGEVVHFDGGGAGVRSTTPAAAARRIISMLDK